MGEWALCNKARQLSLDRIVAIKMILFGSLASAEQIRRFRIEASAAGSLQHPNIVAVHEVGLHEGQHFLVMDYVDGPNLSRLVQDQPVPAKQAATYLKSIAEAVQYAHDRGILHRDLKPSNVLIGSDDRPRVTDFGLAKRLALDSSLATDPSSLTLSGHVLGSPNYLPPEQAGGGKSKVGRASDVYSLGAILYHLLTARPPFRAETLSETLQQVQTSEPLSPRLLNASVPRDLETICLKCLEKEPARRYETAQGVAEELNRFLTDEPIHARPVTRAERAWRWCRFLYNLSAGRDQLKVWDMTTWEEVLIVPPARPASVRWQWDPKCEAAYAVDQTQHSLTVYALPNFEHRSTLHLSGLISKAAISDDRQTLAVSFQEGAFQKVRVWDLARQAPIGTVGNFDAAISILRFSRDGSLLAASSTDGSVGIWNLKTLEPLPAPPRGATHVSSLEFTPDNKWLLCNNEFLFSNSSLGVWDIGTAQTFAVEPTGKGYFHLHGFSPDGDLLVVSWGSIELTVLDSRTLVPRGIMRGHRGLVGGIAFSPNGKLLASASVDQTVRIWDLATQTQVGIVGGFGEAITGVEFSADGQNVVLISKLGQIWVYSLSAVLRRGLFASISGWQDEGFSRLAVASDDRLLATISVQGTLAVWDRRKRSLIRSNSFPRYTEDSYPNVAFSPDGKRMTWTTGDALRTMLADSGEISETPIDGNREVNSVAFSPQGDEVAFGCGKQVLIQELASGRQESLTATDDEVLAVKYSPDGRLVAFGDRVGTVTLCERASGQVLSRATAHAPIVLDVEFAPDGTRLATCGTDSTTKLWRVQSNGLHLQDILRG
ncbi:MAG: protein kinase, partial [Verrucomicrobiales bacterium]|nr:protein kinase [Verrucomicrobiales bacterium]